MKLRLLSLLLALTLVLSLLPVGVAAADENPNVVTEGNIIFDLSTQTVTGVTTQSITALIIPETIRGVTVLKIADTGVFADCASLGSVTIPKTITHIGADAFRGCGNLTTVTIEDGAATLAIGPRAFAQTGISSITLPDSVNSIAGSAFTECRTLTSIAIPSGVSKIDDDTFYGCVSLSLAVIPKGTNVSGNAFSNCQKLTMIHYLDNIEPSWKDDIENKDVHLARLTVTATEPSTCTKAGFRVEKIFCNSCNKEIMSTTRYIKLAPHQEVAITPAEIPATCEQTGSRGGTKCSICETVVVPPTIIDALGHDWKETLREEKKPTCQEAGLEIYDLECKRCGMTDIKSVEKNMLNHTYTNTNGWNDPQIVQKTDCGKDIPKVTIKTRICDVCKEPVAYSEDDFKKDLESILKEAETNPKDTITKEYTHKIEYADKTEAEIVVYELTVTPSSHTPGDIVKIEQGNATKKYNCAEGGSGYKVTYKCKECGKEFALENVTLEAGSHVQGTDANSVVKQTPTCSVEGIEITTSTCPVCETVFEKEDKIPTTPHTPGDEEVIATTATCYKPGVETVVVHCTVCNQEISRTQRPVSVTHQYEEDETKRVEPSCTKTGKSVFVCKVCGDIDEREIPMVEHTYGDAVTDDSHKEATCTEDGVITKTRVCKVCGYKDVEKEVVEEAPGHKPLAPEKVKVEKEATCTEEGVAIYNTTCKVCKEDLQGTKVPIPALGHDFGPWTTSGSTRTRTCKREGCGYKETDASSTPSNPSEPSNPSNPGSSSNTYYSVDVIRPANGSISVSTSSARADTRVTVTLRPNSGYQLDSVWVTRSGSGRNVALSGNGTNRYTFIMPAARVEVRAAFSSISGTSTNTTTPPNDRNTNPTKNVVVNIPQISSASTPAGSRVFVDVPSSFWAQGEIAWACQKGFISGSGGNFFPNNPITVRQLWMVMARMMGKNPANMEEARLWALNNGFADGGNPNAALTRLQLATMLYRCARLMGSKNTNTTNLGNFTDSRNIPASAKNAMAWAVANGIITGTTDGRLNPSGTVSRAQFCVILYRYYQRLF